MAIPNIGSLSLPSGQSQQLAGLGQALGQFPMLAQLGQLQQLQVQAEKQKQLQQILQSLDPQMRANPTDPGLIRQVKQLYRTAGMPTTGAVAPAGPSAAVQTPQGAPDPQGGLSATQGSKQGTVPMTGPQGKQSPAGAFRSPDANAPLASVGRPAVGSNSPLPGLNIPAGAQGQQPEHLNPDAMSEGPPQIFSNMDVQSRTTAMAVPAGAARRAIMAGVAGVPEWFYDAPQILDLRGREDLRQDFQKTFTAASAGNMSPQAYNSWVEANRTLLPQIGMDPDSLQRDSSVVGTMGAKVLSDIKWREQMGFAKKGEYEAALARVRVADSTVKLNTIRGDYLGEKQYYLSAEEKDRANTAQANMDKAQAFIQEAGARAAALGPGSWQARAAMMREYTSLNNSVNNDLSWAVKTYQGAANAFADPDEALQPIITNATNTKAQMSTIGRVLSNPRSTPAQLQQALGQLGVSSSYPGATPQTPATGAGGGPIAKDAKGNRVQWNGTTWAPYNGP